MATVKTGNRPRSAPFGIPMMDKGKTLEVFREIL
jgi:hypothetical protein